MDAINRISRFCFITTVAVICFSLTFAGSINAEEETATKRISQIAVMPFLKGKKPETVETIMTCRLNRLCLEEDMVIASGAQTMTVIVQKALGDHFHDRMVPREKVKIVFEKIIKKTSETTPLDLAIKVGRELQVGYVVLGNVWRFRQRSSDGPGSGIPASVAFQLHLVDVDREARRWDRSFEKTQQTLASDLFRTDDFFKQGPRWLTAEELARVGVDKVLRDFPIKKVKER